MRPGGALRGLDAHRPVSSGAHGGPLQTAASPGPGAARSQRGLSVGRPDPLQCPGSTIPDPGERAALPPCGRGRRCAPAEGLWAHEGPRAQGHRTQGTQSSRWGCQEATSGQARPWSTWPARQALHPAAMDATGHPWAGSACAFCVGGHPSCHLLTPGARATGRRGWSPMLPRPALGVDAAPGEQASLMSRAGRSGFSHADPKVSPRQAVGPGPCCPLNPWVSQSASCDGFWTVGDTAWG